jgi:hypothetical protein
MIFSEFFEIGGYIAITYVALLLISLPILSIVEGIKLRGKPVLAWIGHQGSPRERACFICARSEGEAYYYAKKLNVFDGAFLRVERIPSADCLTENKMPGTDYGCGEKALYHYLTNNRK